MNDSPISGVAILLPDEDMDLVMLEIRLPADQTDLAKIILEQVENTRGGYVEKGLPP